MNYLITRTNKKFFKKKKPTRFRTKKVFFFKVVLCVLLKVKKTGNRWELNSYNPSCGQSVHISSKALKIKLLI